MAEVAHYQKEYPEWSRHLQGLHERYVDPFVINVQGRDVVVLQENVMQAEDLSLVLSHYFCNETVFPLEFWNGKRIIELGSGTGIVGRPQTVSTRFDAHAFTGTVMASLGADVVITDKHPQTELIKKTTERNKQVMVGTHSVQELLWGQDVAAFGKPYDVIIASECIYYNDLVGPLCDSMRKLSNGNTDIYLSYETHNDESVDFFMEEASLFFDISLVPHLDHHREFQSEYVNIIKMRLKQSLCK
ncbi:methyltransferase-like protein 21D-like [Planoprotostelium fungivorum]|uniref:Methyltransferase-like protein 21D-like n=1 Tax=Planoprotostelium fungivorum TaxID=1890364 RepID=A0A2P6N9V3_9EUKA|nr:methyltransferase-like protein 21D-like [Planoprotostelium fungivorum]